ncbi:MAG: ATP synthase F1 subunit delta [Lachnospiraceae bacterium]
MAKLTEKVYGEALFELALEEGRTESLLQEVKEVKQVLLANPELAKLMQHPGIPEGEKEKILENIWDKRISREITGLMLLLLKKEHYGELIQVLDYFIAKVQEKEKIGIAYVKTAVPLSEEQKKKVEKRLLETTSYRSFEMHFAVEEALIGGMVIRIGDRVLDSSIRTKLANLSRQLYQIKLQ